MLKNQKQFKSHLSYLIGFFLPFAFIIFFSYWLFQRSTKVYLGVKVGKRSENVYGVARAEDGTIIYNKLCQRVSFLFLYTQRCERNRKFNPVES